MEARYFKMYSPSLGRDMELKVYGSSGRPVLFIPCQDGRFFDFENFRMTDVWQPWIDEGRVMVFAVDTLDRETWSAGSDPRVRILRHEQWMNYLFDEVVPFARQQVAERGCPDRCTDAIAFGCSLGATHAANCFFRRPDLFGGLLALSGIYTASYGFGEYSDDLVYLNSPVDYLAGMPADHPYIRQYNRGRSIIVVGQGPWEAPDTTFRLREIFAEKGIHTWVDVWGYDVCHDWSWWYEQVRYHVPHLLDD